jgi:hypothetical protein
VTRQLLLDQRRERSRQMPARNQQTFAKRARELAVKEKRERKQAKKAEARAARDGTVAGESNDDGALAYDQPEAATPSALESK